MSEPKTDVSANDNDDSMGTVSTSRCHILNDDILGLILNELSIRQLLRLESVCYQFLDCVGSALQKRTNGLAIGFNYRATGEDISKAFVYDSYHHTFDLIQCRPTLDSLLQKLPNISELHLTDTCMDYAAFDVIVTRCQRLTRLSLNGVYIQCESNDNIDAYVNQCIGLVSRLSHLKSLSLVLRRVFGVDGVRQWPSLTYETLSNFAELDVLQLTSNQNCIGFEELANFCIVCIANRGSKKPFRLELDNRSLCMHLVTHLRQLNVSIPDDISIKTIYE